MKLSNTEELSDTRKILTVAIPSEESKEQEEKLVKKYASEANIPGFRPGKVPPHIIRQKFKKNLQKEASNELIKEAYENAIRDCGLDVYGVVDANIDGLEIGQDSDVTFTVDYIQEFELPSYKGLELKKHAANISDTDVESVIKNIRGQRADFNSVERPAEKEDYVKLSYEGFVGETPIQEIAPDSPLYTKQSGTWEEAGDHDSPGVKGIVENLSGKHAGDTFEATHTFPDDFEVEALAGKEATYKVEIFEVREKVLPELDDEFLESLQVTSVEELRSGIRKQLESQNEQQQSDSLRRQVFDAIDNHAEVRLPEQGVEERKENVREEIKRTLQNQASDEETDESKIEQQADNLARQNFKRDLVLQKIASEEELEVTEEDFKQHIMQIAMQTRTNPEEIVNALQKDQQQVSQLREEILRNKAIDFIIENANIENVDSNIEQNQNEDDKTTSA